MTDPADRDPVLMAARAICAEQCAMYGEPPCYEHGWPNPDCDEPGCIALATAACAALLSERHRAEEAMRERAAEVADADVRVEAPTPPAATSDGEEDEWVEMDPIDLMDVSPLVAEALKAARQTIADLEQRLAEQTIAKVDYFASLVEAERQRDEATALVERLRGALKPVTITEHDAEMDAFLAGVEGAIEASGCERQDLWECWHQRKRMLWEQCMSGLMTQVGTFADMPVCVSLQKARIDGHLVLFYHATSLVVQHDIVRAWLDAHLPDTARRDGRIVHADAMNAINVMHTLRRAALLSEPQASEGRDG